MFCPRIQLKLCSKKKKTPPLPATNGHRKKKKNPVINLRHEAWKKDRFFQESQEFWCVGCCKLKPGPGCQRAKGWCHRVVLGDKNRNYKCWKSQTGACVESPVTPPLCFTLWGTWLTGSQVWAKTLLSNIWAPRAPDLLAGKDIWMCPPSTLTLYSTSIACGLGANTKLIFVILLLTA